MNNELTIREIYKQDSQCEMLLEKIEEIKNHADEEGMSEIGYLTLDHLENCIEEFRKYIAIMGELNVYSLICDRLNGK